MKGKKFYYIGHLNRLHIPKNYKWPKEHFVFLDLTGCEIIIQKNVTLSRNVFIYTHTHQFNKSNWRKLGAVYTKEPTILKKNCFIGTNAIITYSCKNIGECSAIGAGAVVTKNIPPYEMWAGNPAKKIGEVI